MRRIVDESFGLCHHYEASYVIEGRSFERCEFRGVSIHAVGDPPVVGERPTVRDVVFDSCSGPVHLSGAALEQVTVAGLKGVASLQFCLFDRVVLGGRFRGLAIESSPFAHQQDWSDFVAENDRRYETIEWALDVSEATFENEKIRDIPPEKIRVDPERQAVITVESTRGGAAAFEGVDLVGVSGSLIRGALAGKRLTDHLVSVQAGSKTADQELEQIRRLHEHGLALPVI